MYLAVAQKERGYFLRQIWLFDHRFDFRRDFFLVFLCLPQVFTNYFAVNLGNPFRQGSASIQDDGGIFIVVSLIALFLAFFIKAPFSSSSKTSASSS